MQRMSSCREPRLRLLPRQPAEGGTAGAEQPRRAPCPRPACPLASPCPRLPRPPVRQDLACSLASPPPCLPQAYCPRQSLLTDLSLSSAPACNPHLPCCPLLTPLFAPCVPHLPACHWPTPACPWHPACCLPTCVLPSQEYIGKTYQA